MKEEEADLNNPSTSSSTSEKGKQKKKPGDFDESDIGDEEGSETEEEESIRNEVDAAVSIHQSSLLTCAELNYESLEQEETSR